MTINIILIAVISLAIGLLLGFFVCKSRMQEQHNKEVGQLSSNIASAESRLLIAQQQTLHAEEGKRQREEDCLALEEEKDKLLDIIEKLKGECAEARQAASLAEQRLEDYRKSVDEARKEEEQHRKSQQEAEQELRDTLLRQAKEQNAHMCEQLMAKTQEMVRQTQTSMQEGDSKRIDDILKPLKEKIDTFQQTVSTNTRTAAENKTELKTSFEELVKGLQESHRESVRALTEQTNRIGEEANALTHALKADTKKQGNWGEMILEQTLQACGLEKNVQFFLQPHYVTKKGDTLIPDAVVEFPTGERVIIDSKVSLTAFANALETHDDEEHSRLMRQHADSVRKHVKELADKNYPKVVDKSISMVLMFIPNESSYMAALKEDSDILAYAYKQHVIVISPANLLVSLQLVYTMWQRYDFDRNAEKILDECNKLYDKFVGFTTKYEKMGSTITSLSSLYSDSFSQLTAGTGNIVGRFEKIRKLGLKPTKHLSDKMTENTIGNDNDSESIESPSESDTDTGTSLE